MAPVTRGQEQAAGESSQKAKITLYWLEESRAQRILWLLEELKLDYEIKTFKRVDQLAPDEFKEVHPLGKAPVVKVEPQGSSKPIILAETSFIVDYLLDHFGQSTNLVPDHWKKGSEGQIGGETEGWLRYRYLLYYMEGSLMPLLVTSLLFDILKTKAPFFVRPIVRLIAGNVDSLYLKPNLKAHWGFLETQLATSPDNGEYLCGAQLTAADILMSFPLASQIDQVPHLTKEEYPKFWAYLKKLQTEEGYQKANKKIEEVGIQK